MDFFVGTLTKEGGEGILRCRLEGGRIQRVHTIPNISNPNYVILSNRGSILYAVNEDAEASEFAGGVNVYDVAGPQPLLRARRKTNGDGPCFLALSPDGSYLYAANYTTGSLAVFSTQGGLSDCIQLVQHQGHGPHPVRQAGPHLHQVTFLPGTQYLCAVDLGIDALVTYYADEKTGMVAEHARSHLPGGPRHIVYGRKGMAYAVHELSNEVTALQIADGRFLPIQTLSTLPHGVACENTASAIRLSMDGTRLYVSNRGYGSIAVYDVHADGTLRAREQLFGGIFPRDFVLLNDGTYMVADQRAGVYYVSPTGEPLDFLPQLGAVCLCPSI